MTEKIYVVEMLFDFDGGDDVWLPMESISLDYREAIFKKKNALIYNPLDKFRVAKYERVERKARKKR